MKKTALLFDLMTTFMKIGLFTFGGGYAMISMIDNACVEQKKWITHDEMMNITVIAESTPGPIAINCATYVGHKMAGFIGAVLSTLGIILPSFLIIYVISMFLDNFLEIPLIANAFKGIRVGVGILILDAGLGMLKKMPKKPQARITACCAFAAMLVINFCSFQFSSITLMLMAGTISLTLFIIKGTPLKKGGSER